MTAPPAAVAANEALVVRAVAEVINGRPLDAVDELYAPGIAHAAKDWVAPFRAAPPDVRMEVAALVGRATASWGTSAARAPGPAPGGVVRPDDDDRRRQFRGRSTTT